MYAMPCPPGGLINPRSHTAFPKMYFELLGWVLPVRDRNADKIVRLRASAPTARSAKRSSDRALRSARIGDTIGEVFAACRNTAPVKNSPPLPVLGHGRLCRRARRAP